MATAATSQGIMGLPASEKAPAPDMAMQPQLGLDDSYDAVQQGLQNASPDAHSAVNAELAKLAPQLDQLPDEVLDQLLQIIQYMHDNPKEYSKALQEMVDAGIIEEGDFPEEYDPEFLATLGMVIMQAKKSRQGAQSAAAQPAAMPMPPAGMARGGIAEAAHLVASKGRGQDTMLAHITPREAKMLRAKGGMGTINPATGLPEYGWFSNAIKSVGNAIGGAVKGVANAVSGAVKSVAGAVKSIVSSPIGKVLGTVALATFAAPLLGITSAVGSMAFASGAVTALGGGNIKDVLKSAAIGGATAFFGAPGGAVSNFVRGAVTNAAANAAITSGIVGTGIGLLSGQKLQDAVKSGLTAGAISGLATGATKGFSAQIEAPKVPTATEMAAEKGAVTSPVKPQTDLQGTDLPGMEGGPRNFAPVTNADGTTTAFLGRSAIDPTTGQPPFVNYGNAPAAPSSDVLGDFIAQNDAARQLASTPAVNKGYVPPTFERAYDEFSRGEYGNAAKTVFMPEGPTAAQVQQSPAFKDAMAAGASYDTAYKQAAESMGAPGLIRTYGPATAAGLGIAGLAGAFTPKQPQPTPLQNDINQRLADEKARVAANPGAYVPQGLGKFGINYNERGEIIGSQPWNPAPAPGTTEVAGSYMPYTPSPYMSPSGAIGGGQPIYQPFNTASMYTNLMPPQYRAEGGMMVNDTVPDSVLRDGGPVHMALGGALGNLFSGKFLSNVAPVVERAIAQQAQQAQQVQQQQPAAAQAAAQAARVAEIQNSYKPPVPPMQPSVQQPVEVTHYQQSYDPSQISELSRRLYPSIYDQGFRDSILANTAIGQQRGGGIASLATGGYPRRTGQISGPGTETSDSIPAMLSDGEFVMTAKAVRGAGKGNRLAGAKKMYALMHQLERNAARG